ncbi:MAG TPA: ATP-binding cassette domain-containing protein [Acidocella sp.]|nr:ATP-binding cassette domain-containing protein [Acidocella sp.]
MMINLENVTIARGGSIVLRNISLAIRPGEFIGVLGPNGAGKTTLFRTILGLQPVSTGTLSVLGAAPTSGNPAIGYMPQTRAGQSGQNLCGFDVLANAANGHHFGLPFTSPAIKAEVTAALKAVDAEGLAARPLAALSGGQRQRLLLAAALLGAPKLLLLDEPLISLDPAAQASIIALIHHLQQANGLTVLFAAHDINPLLGVMDRVLYLSGGNAALGTVEDIITTQTLSKLYNADIEVLRAGGRIFVLSDRPDHHHACGHDHA